MNKRKFVASVWSKYSKAVVLPSQCDISEFLSGARESLGVSAREEVLINRGHWYARSPPLDFSDVTLALEESAFKLLDVTLAREDDRLGVRRTRQKPRVSLLYVLYRPRNKSFDICYCLVIRLLGSYRAIEQALHIDDFHNSTVWTL